MEQTVLKFIGLSLAIDFLFRKGLALIGNLGNPDEQKRLFGRFGKSEKLRSLYERMKSVLENPRLGAPDPFDVSFPDPNLIAGYLDEPSQQSQFQSRYEEACLSSDTLLAEAASVSVILRLFQEESTSAPKSCRQRAYAVGGNSPSVSRESRSSSRAPMRESADSSSQTESEFCSELDSFESEPKLYAGIGNTFIDKEIPKAAAKPQKERKLKSRRNRSEEAECEKSEKYEKKRTRFFPFFIAALATALVFYFQPFPGFLKQPSSHPGSGNEMTESIPVFSEAPVSEKIATPSAPEMDSDELSVQTIPAADSETLSLLTETEKKETESRGLLYRPLRRGKRSELVTVIPAE